MSAIDGKIILTNNPCYKVGQRMTPKGIVVHSTGCDNPYIKRYVQPDDGIIGKNPYGNSWNNGSEEVCVHGFLGKDKNGKVKFYQTLPFDICCWGVGGGWKGSYNYNPAYIQFEICEDDLSSKSYCKACYNKAVEVCAYLCKTYDIKPSSIVSHYEAYLKGYGSDHVDPHNWWDKYGYTMSGFRKAVADKLREPVEVRLRRSGVVYKYAYKDVLGKSSKRLRKLVKGEKVTWLADDGFGWSQVKTGAITGWIMNIHLDKSGLSKFKALTLGNDIKATEIVKGKRAGTKVLKKGTAFKLICTIERGEYKGKDYIAVGKARYYI